MKMKRSNGEQGSRKIKNNAGFYIALGVCILTVAAAAWSTYGSISSDMGETESQVSKVEAANDVSGESYEKSSSPEQKESSGKSGKKENTAKTQESTGGSTTKEKQEASAKETAAVPQKEKEESRAEEEGPVFPVEGADVVKPFSITKPIYSKTTADWRSHKGIDIKVNKGAAVRSVSEGTVADVTADPLYGNTIVIEQSGSTVRYCGLSDRSLVKKGDHVSAGSVIGYANQVPCEQLDDPHIHVEVIRGEKYIDPMLLFDSQLSK